MLTRMTSQRSDSILVLTIELIVGTGFTGSLIIPGDVADEMDLEFQWHEEFLSVTGTTFFASACSTEIDWLGKRTKVPIARSGEIKEALLGSQMLRDCRLTVDYGQRTVTICES